MIATQYDRSHKDYESARLDRIFNRRRPAKYPSDIVFVESKEDVVKAVNHAREKRAPVTIRSGGHSWAAWSLRQGCLLIDLSKLKQLDVDAGAMTATVSPSTTGKMLNEALGPLGLMFNGGHCPDVGVGGFLLQGGQGWCARNWGWSAEQIVSMEVVTAEGKLVTASRNENADLFWAARGSGPGFFGVVVSFTLTLRKVVPMFGSTYIYDTEAHYDEVAKWYLEACPNVPSDCELVMLGFRSERVLPHLNPPRAVILVRALCFTEDKDEAERALTIFARGVPSVDRAHVAAFCVPSSFTEEYQRQADDNPIGRYFVQNAWLDGPLDKVSSSMKVCFSDLPTPQSFALHFSMAPLRPIPDDMCFSIQTPHTLSLYTIAPPDTDAFDAQCEAYHDKVWPHIDALTPEEGGSAGIYLGDSDLVTRPVRFMSETNWTRFCQIRNQWDPNSVFAGYDGEALHGPKRWNRNPWEGLRS